MGVSAAMSDLPRTPPPTPASTAAEPATRDLRLGTKALCSRDGQVLLIEEGRGDGSTFWTLPGGGVTPDESPSASLRRELAEELQCEVSCGESVGTCTYDHTRFGEITTLYTVYDCTLESEPTPNREEAIRQHAWIEPTALPEGVLEPFEALLDELVDAGFFD